MRRGRRPNDSATGRCWRGGPTTGRPAGKLEEAEAAAHSLLAEYPGVHDGWDRLGMVHEARGQNREAADCYRKALDVIRQHPDDYDPEFADVFVRLIAKLDPSPVS